MLCSYPHHPPPEFFSSCETETLSLLNMNSPLTTPIPGSCHSAFCLKVCLFKGPHINGVILFFCWSFCDCPLSPSIVSSRFIHIVACVQISFLFRAEYYSILEMDHILFIHSSLGHLGCFHVLATVSKVSVTVGIPFIICVFLFAYLSLNSQNF